MDLHFPTILNHYGDVWVFISHLSLIPFPLKGRLFDVHFQILVSVSSIFTTFWSVVIEYLGIQLHEPNGPFDFDNGIDVTWGR